jgi:hypothetical protein
MEHARYETPRVVSSMILEGSVCYLTSSGVESMIASDGQNGSSLPSNVVLLRSFGSWKDVASSFKVLWYMVARHSGVNDVNLIVHVPHDFRLVA